jgi:hypothetical protein
LADALYSNDPQGLLSQAAAELRRLSSEVDVLRNCLFQMQEAAKQRAEPVAWMDPDYTDPRKRLEMLFHFVSHETGPIGDFWVPVYTHPAPDDTALRERLGEKA